MPYIDKEMREQLDERIDALPSFGMASGVKNYVITRFLLNSKPITYEEYNALIGVLECVKQEFYRRAVSVYEDVKIAENGDVY